MAGWLDEVFERCRLPREAMRPRLAMPDCAAKGASVYGTITVSGGRPRLQGPVRLASLDCPGPAAKLAQAGIQADVTLDETLDGGDAKLSLKSGVAAYGANRAQGLGGNLDLTYRFYDYGSARELHLDEAMEVITLLQTGKRDMVPIVLLDPPGGMYWQTLQDFIKNHLLRSKLISPEDLSLYRLTDSVQEAVDDVRSAVAKVRSDLPGVGENLADHPGVDLDTGFRGAGSVSPILHSIATMRRQLTIALAKSL